MGHIPKLGMDFDSVEDAWEFWTEFGARTGFTPRRFYSHTSRKDGLLSNTVFVCNKEHKHTEESELMMKKRERAETRTSCQVKLGIHREPTTFGKYRVYRLHLKHNHVLHTRATVHMMPSQRYITRIQANEIELADASGIQIKKSHELMERAGGESTLSEPATGIDLSRNGLENPIHQLSEKDLL